MALAFSMSRASHAPQDMAKMREIYTDVWGDATCFADSPQSNIAVNRLDTDPQSVELEVMRANVSAGGQLENTADDDHSLDDLPEEVCVEEMIVADDLNEVLVELAEGALRPQAASMHDLEIYGSRGNSKNNLGAYWQGHNWSKIRVGVPRRVPERSQRS